MQELSLVSDGANAATPTWAGSARISGAFRGGATPGANFRPVCGLGAGSWILLPLRGWDGWD